MDWWIKFSNYDGYVAENTARVGSKSTNEIENPNLECFWSDIDDMISFALEFAGERTRFHEGSAV